MSHHVITPRYPPFATPAPTGPSHERIGALTATLALNLGALIVLTLPLSAPSTHVPLVVKPFEMVDVRPASDPPPQVPRPVVRERAAASTTPLPAVAPLPAAAIAPVERGMAPALPPMAIPSGTTAIGPAAEGPAAAGAAEAGLEYVHAPDPRYPREALRQGLQGTVWLRVLVDEAGLPSEVSVEHSSGHRVLDEAARRQVLAQWRFQPALRDGRPVPAWGRVPIDFRL